MGRQAFYLKSIIIRQTKFACRLSITRNALRISQFVIRTLRRLSAVCDKDVEKIIQHTTQTFNEHSSPIDVLEFSSGSPLVLYTGWRQLLLGSRLININMAVIYLFQWLVFANDDNDVWPVGASLQVCYTIFNSIHQQERNKKKKYSRRPCILGSVLAY